MATNLIGFAEDLTRIFPRHKCSLTLTHNQHKDYYETVEQYCHDISGGSWISEEQRQKAFDTDEIWECQWYPDTPIGSYFVRACDLKALLEYLADWKG